MDHLEVLREKIARLRAEIAHIDELNQEYRLRKSTSLEAQVAYGERQERLLTIQQELIQLRDLGVKVVSVEKMKAKDKDKGADRLHLVDQARAS